MVLVEPTAPTNEASSDADTQAPHDSAVEQSSVVHPAADANAAFEDAAAILDEPAVTDHAASPDLTETVEDLNVQAKQSTESQTDPVATPPESDSNYDEDEGPSDLSPPPLPESGEVLLPNADWTSETSVQWRNRALTAIAAVIGVVLAMLLFVIFTGDNNAPHIAAKNEPPIKKPPTEATPPDDIGTNHSDQLVDSESPDTPSETSIDNETASSEQDSEAVVDPPQVIDEPAPDTEAAPNTTDTDPESENVPPETATPSEPTTEPPGLTPKEDPIESEMTTERTSPLSETLRDFGALLDDTPKPTPEKSVIDTDTPIAADDDVTADESEEVVPSGMRSIIIDDRLNDPVVQIQFDGTLANFLQLASDYSTIPITLDADILRWARVSPNTKVRFDIADTNVAGLLEKGLAPLALHHEVVADQLLVTRRPSTETGLREVTFKVRDLVGDSDEQLQWLGDQIMDFVAPQSWSSRGGVGTMTYSDQTIVVEQHEIVQFGILEFCEKLRVARDVETQTRRIYPPEMFRLETRTSRAQDALARSITLTYLQKAPLQSIVKKISEQADVDILIDWIGLASANWGPDATTLFTVNDQPLAKALQTLLDPMDLAYRVVDEHTIQITAKDAVSSESELEFYQLAGTDTADMTLVEQARDALGRENFHAMGGSGQLVLDEASNCVIAYLSQPKQLELQAWLNARLGIAAKP